MNQNFRKVIKKYPNEILLDKNLGSYLWSIFYDRGNYEEWLGYFLEKSKKVEEKIKNYFNQGLVVKNFKGEEIKINKDNIVMEINRCPQVDFGIRPSYYASFAHMSEILEKSLDEKDIKIKEDLIKKAIPVYKKIEDNQTLHFIAEPATFSYLDNRTPRYKTEISTPPNTNQPLSINPILRFFIRKGVYVTVTGIYGVNHLFEKMKNMNLRIYTHKKGLLPFGIRAVPAVVRHKNILLHFARVGWGSAWLSFFSETPLIALPFDSKDEPEVYFNNICLEKIGLGKVYKGQSVNDLLKWEEEYKNNVRAIKNKLIDKYGTLNGVEYTAKKIVDHYLNL